MTVKKMKGARQPWKDRGMFITKLLLFNKKHSTA